MIESKLKLELLQHCRHDWMNKLQMIKGNLELSNIERATQIIDEMVIESRQEALLTGLGTPSFSEWLLTYNWYRPGPLRLGYEFTERMKIPEAFDHLLLNWAKKTTAAVDKALNTPSDQELYFLFEQYEESFSIVVEYEGEPLQSSPEEIIQEPIEAQVEWIKQSSASFSIKLTFDYPVSGVKV
ncbi:Spo0B domain-containing protein [Jeotgalibacillus haloalkalitolerans]|uniref:Spo0B domain-containing protein n=1 Tax=Jeotgalibacillus haloalkalitolerans TaxID=3104292 RepID=A0ABU5KM50_9BACL|nr:Spo0B domain-containing protein [Jeotgalibacillus sp. HH7-29]MDZ5712347.1 Spo0B domain-containing protein [Jeotgalibacillus sp. HH7-29]